MLIETPNSDINDDEIKDVATKLGIDLEENDDGKEGNEFDPSKKTDTEVNESGRTDESEKDTVDYKEKYAASTKEFQEKYKPMEDKIKSLEQLSGKGIDDLLADYTKVEEKIEDNQPKQKKDASVDDEVIEKISQLEKKIGSMEEKVLEQDQRNQLSAKERVSVFRSKYEIAEDDYTRKYKPFLTGIKEMRKENGDPYTLEEALELSYVLANKDNIDKIVARKIQIKQKEQDLSFSPGGAKQSSSYDDKPKLSEAQVEAAKRMGINLDEEQSS